MRKKFLLRIPPDLWEEVNRWAKDDLRSVNGQIEYLLRRAVLARKGNGAPNENGETGPTKPGIDG